MNKWIQLLQEPETSAPPSVGTAKTDTSPPIAHPQTLLAVMSVHKKGGSANSGQWQQEQTGLSAWGDADITSFKHYRHVATAAGFGTDAAEEIADRLVSRDRDRDDRRACIECAELRANGRCSAASRGVLLWASKQFDPVKNVLQRCEAFKGAALLSQDISRTKQVKDVT